MHACVCLCLCVRAVLFFSKIHVLGSFSRIKVARDAIVDLIGYTAEDTIPVAAFYGHHTTVNYLAELTGDPVAAVRLETACMLAEFLTLSGIVTVLSMVIGFLGALAFARYSWRFRKTYQKLILLPIFFPQTVLGLALLMWFNTVGIILGVAPRVLT